ncbi:MAG: protease pro-enzyme activation domain-containing protein [Bryobacteraceae bacterium]
MASTLFRRILLPAVLMSAPMLGQQLDRLRPPIDSSRLVTMPGIVSSRIRGARDLGRLGPSEKISFITLGLRRTAAEQAALNRLLDDLQNPASPDYHHWLTPEEFGQRFGASANDIAQVTAWLKSQGMTVEDTARGRNWIMFSGTAGQIEQAFHTELHRYDVNGERHFAIASDPSVPAALAPLVLGFRGLDDFRLQPAGGHPKFNPPNGYPTPHVLVPGDIAAIYDLDPLYAAGLDGSGQTVAVVGASEVYKADLQEFRSTTGLAALQVQSVVYGTAPGITGAQAEADIDLEWVGAVAPNATIIFVQAEDPFVAAQYAIDQNYAPVLSVSFSSCEANASGFAPEITEALAQQANAQGITWLVASGDQASAACDKTGATMPSVATQGLSVNYPATLPEVTAVGGTMFNEGGGNYWASQNNSDGTSALSYIPEVAWNETSVDGSIAGSTGGQSVLFSKPAWQTGPGVPNDGARDVPDVALDAAAQHDPYLIFTGGGMPGFEGGTSVATPIFAGIVVLLNQYLVANGIQSQPGLGNINPTLYRLAQSAPQAFHDITQGNNIVQCSGGFGCNGGYMGFSAGPGYDLVTGLGSVDAANLINQWSASGGTTASGVAVTVTANPSSLTIAGSTTLTATVTASGSATPSGSVSFVSSSTSVTGTTTLGSATLAAGGNSATASLQVYGSQLTVGSDTITAVYAGDSSLNSGSGSVILTVTQPVAAAAIVPLFTPNPVYEQKTDSDGFSWFFNVTLTDASDVGATLTGFTFGGTDYSSSISSFFGSSQLAPDGALAAALRAKINSVPSTVVLGFSGIDANGNDWSTQISVPFYGRQTTASLALSSTPSIVEQDPTVDSDCQYLQQLNIQEQNGYGVVFTKFTGAGQDLTQDIQEFFGSLRLPPFGALTAGICWTGITPPETIEYEIDAVDSNGNKVVATGSALFRGPASAPGTLALSVDSINLSAANSSQSSTATVNVSVPEGQGWSLAMLPANQYTSWLEVWPLSGTGPGQVTIIAAGAGLSNGAYFADLAFQSTDTLPQYLDLPILFTIGGSANLSIRAVGNGASFQNDAAAPGMVLSVFGTNLAPSTQQASAIPLPLSLGGVSATIDGVAAPLYFVSSQQWNIQVPYETPAGPALLAVNNNGQVTTFGFDVSFSAPGIFTDAHSNMVPYPSGKRGQTLTMFVTGEGDVAPAVATGASPKPGTAATSLPAPVLPATLTIGGVPATIDFIGVPSGLAGVTQINFTVPANAPLGVQPVELTVGTAVSPAANFTVNQ